MVFTGDLVFYRGVGRTDFPGGNFDDLIEAIKNRIFVLPKETAIYPGHEARLSTLAVRLDRLAPLPELEHRLGDVDDLEAALASLGRAIPALETTVSREAALRRQKTTLARRLERLAGMDDPPALSPTAPLAGLLARRQAMQTARDRLAGRRLALERLASPPALSETAPLADTM